MIIFRYLSKEIVTALFAISAILLVILLSNQMARYLGYAADGRLPAQAVFQLLSLEIPQLLALLLPLGLYLSILFTYGRMYTENEMTILTTSGLSPGSLMRLILPVTLGVVLLSALLTLWFIPHLMLYRNQLLEQTGTVAKLQSLLPGRFQELDEGRRVIYIEQLSKDRKEMKGLFMAEQKDSNWIVLSAAEGHQRMNQKMNSLSIVTTKGFRYAGIPGQNDYQVIQYGQYSVRLQNQPIEMSADEDTFSTASLLAAYHLNKKYAATFQWRISLPLMGLVLMLIAVPLSKISRGQGRYAKMLPAVLIYILYANMLFVGRAWMNKGTLSPDLGLWWIHGCMLILALGLFLGYNRRYLQNFWNNKRALA